MDKDYRRLPGVDRLLSDEGVIRVRSGFAHDLLVDIIREQLERERESIAAGRPVRSIDKIAAAVCARLEALGSPSLRRVVNASGVIIHTNLGRAPLSDEAIAAMDAVGRGFSNLEFNLETGVRGSRHVHVEGLLCQLTGAEAAMAVNNNAGAVLLGLTALARRREVIVSRGQAVEIGGGFRIPDVMRQSGAKLVEVGTTNCTYAADFESAITPRTAALLRVHSSNFRVVGFTAEASLAEIIEVGRRSGVPVVDDLGSGCFLDTTRFGLAPEPMVQQSVSEGVVLTFFSGDKLVGGPQAGIIVGQKEYIDKCKRHPLARALRMDKSRLAGLAATLLHYLRDEATVKIPVWRMIAAHIEEIERRAESWSATLKGHGTITTGQTMVGGGSLPGGSLPTRLVAISGGRLSAKVMAERLRRREIPVIGHISEDALYLDPRTVLPKEDEIVIAALRELAAALK